MKSFGYSDPVILFYVLQLLVQLSCQKATYSSENHVKKLSKDWKLKKSGIKYAVEVDFKHKTNLLPKKGKTKVEAKHISAKIYSNQKKDLPSKEGKNDVRHNVSSHTVAKADNNYNHRSAPKQRVKDSIQVKNTSVSETHRRVKTESEHENKKGKKKIFKKYGLFRSFALSPQQPEEYPPVGIGAGLSNERYVPEAGAVQEGGMGGQDQAPQQDQQLDESNSLSQFSTSQDNGYPQDNSQSAIANFVNTNSDDAGPSDGGQSERLDQALQLQRETYAQQPREQGQDQDNAVPDNQGGGIEGQLGQEIGGGQVQFQPDQGSPARDQGTVVGQVQDQAEEDSDYDRNGFHQQQTQEPEQQQQQPQEMDQQLPEYGDQQLQQQDQPQEYLPQQQREEQQESEEGARLQTPGISALSSSYGGLFSPESEQPMPGQQGQGITDYTSEQPSEDDGKNEPSVPQYASSLTEALREQAGLPQEVNSEGKENQDGIAPDENGNVINIGGAADSNDGRNHEYMETGALNSPSGFSTAALSENEGNNQLETSPEVNGYAPMNNGQNLNNYDGRFAGLEEMQQAPAAGATTDTQGVINFGGPQIGGSQFGGPQFGGAQFHQPASGTKIPTAEEEFYKIINIANKNGPTAVKGCKGCPPHASCIDKVCIINDDQPLAHILSALSGPERAKEPAKVDCKECHYNANCDKTGCVCKPGYTGDGQDCRPDTCLPGCKQHGKCIKGFCICDHHHYFNGYECAPYKIKHKICPMECTTLCQPTCPANCCKHHPVVKAHNNDENPNPAILPSPAPTTKNTTITRPEIVVLKQDKEVENIADYASEFDKRPDDSEVSNFQTVDLKNPTAGFSVSEMKAKPLLEEDCPGPCKMECRESCPVRCCLRKCPINCMENCRPSCPKRCCYLPGVKNSLPMMDPKVQENFLKVMAQKFCPTACRTKCDSNCPPICCKHITTKVISSNDTIPKVNGEVKNSDNFFRNAMSWFGMMNFLNMMYNMYGNLYANNHTHQLSNAKSESNITVFHPPKPKHNITEKLKKFQQVGVAEGPRKAAESCPLYCNKTCIQTCPPKCCKKKPAENPLKPPCQPSCKWFCSKSCPAGCCIKANSPKLVQHHPTVPLTTTKTTTVHTSTTAPTTASTPAKPPATCTPGCPAYCYPQCLENCCRRGQLPTPKQNTDTHLGPTQLDHSQQPYNTFFSNAPTLLQQGCPSSCDNRCGISCPLRCCRQLPASPLHFPLTSSPLESQDSHLCPGNCVSECFPACTLSCCNAGSDMHHARSNPPQIPTQRPKEPVLQPLTMPLSPPRALCRPGCSRSCYPSCDETCCRASFAEAKPTQGKSVLHYTVKVPCPSECRPYNCLYYCHHDCCLNGKSATEAARMTINPSYAVPSVPQKVKKSFRERSKRLPPAAKPGDFHTKNKLRNSHTNNPHSITHRGNRRTLKLKKKHLSSWIKD